MSFGQNVFLVQIIVLNFEAVIYDDWYQEEIRFLWVCFRSLLKIQIEIYSSIQISWKIII